MVQKTSKRGVYSGNTLRSSYTKFHRQYNRRSCLLRKSWMHTKINGTILDDMNINQDDVIYSLNKKGRWELPDIIRNSILWGSYKDLKSNVKLIVSHNISKKSHTVGYYASKGKTKKVESKRKTYFNGESVAAKASYDNKNASNGEQPVLQIEVVYPTPNTCSMVHNPKYVGHYIEKPDNGRGKTSKSKRRRQKLTVEKYCEELYDAYEDEFDESDTEDEVDDESHVYIYGNSSNDASNSTELLNDIMIHAALMQSLCETRNHIKATSSKQKFETKDNKIYEVPVTEDDVTDDESSVSENISSHNETIVQKKMDPVYVVLPKEELDQNLLKERYGNKYTECPCFPRKFIIDVSDRMKHRVLTSGCWKQEDAGKWDLTSCVVFCYDEYDINNTDTNNVYRISLNIATDAERFKILTMFDYFEGCIEEVLQRAVSFLDMLSTDGFIEKENGPPKGELMGAKFENLNRHQKVRKETTYISRKSLYMEIFNIHTLANNTVHELGFESMCSEVCIICFNQITEGGKHGTALTACGHWFCDECWIVHCRSRMIMGANNISCPEYKCEKTVDEAVLLTFINVFEVLNLKRRAMDITLQSSENTKWCPNANCGRAIKVNNIEKAKDVACQCGTLICFQCQQKSHWPVTCDLAPHYWKKMKRLGDDSLLREMTLVQVKVRGKQCPKCKRFIEKLGGCFYMNCACGAQFCWGCLGLFPNHIPTYKCNQGRHSDLKGTHTVVVSDTDAYENISSNRSGDYMKALDHRNARHPLKIKKLKIRVREINFKCKNIAKRKGPCYFAMFTKADRADDKVESEVEEKIRDLLSNMISIYIELHHIAEYSYIFLERLNKNGVKCSQFRSTVDCIGYYANRISDILSETTKVKDFRPLITSLLNIQQKTGYFTKFVVKCSEKFSNLK